MERTGVPDGGVLGHVAAVWTHVPLIPAQAGIQC
jgi:hypothetical protein